MLTVPERTLANFIRAAIPLTNVIAPDALTEPTDWSPIVDAAERHGLAPLLFTALKTLGAQTQPLDPIVETLRASYMRVTMNNWWAQQELSHWLECFQQERIPVVLLKGCVLASTLYANVGVRPVGDLDLLVPRAHVERVRALLSARGYRPFDPRARDDFQVRFASELAFWREGAHPSLLDLHWHVFNTAAYAARAPIEWFWQRTQPIALNGQPAQMLTPEAQLLHLSVHCAGHQWQRLILSYDLALLLAQSTADIDWADVMAEVTAFGFVGILQTTLAQVQDCWGVTIPADVSTWLERLRPDRAERIVAAAMNAKRTEALVVAQGLTTPGLKAKLLFWSAYAFPSVEAMQSRYHIARRWVPLYRVWRLLVMPYRIARSVVTIVRRQ